MARTAKIQKDELLNAAEQVVREKGAANLTLDAVAVRAQVSKGGLLHSFSNKDALVQAMLARMLQDIDEATEAAFVEESPEPSRYGRALVRGGLGSATKPSPQRTALLAAVASDPKFLAGQGVDYRRSLNRMTNDGLDFETASIVALATDGLWLLELLGIAPFDQIERDRIVNALCQLATKKHI